MGLVQLGDNLAICPNEVSAVRTIPGKPDYIEIRLKTGDIIRAKGTVSQVMSLLRDDIHAPSKQ